MESEYFCGLKEPIGADKDCKWHTNDLLYFLSAPPPPLTIDEWRSVYRRAVDSWCRSGRLRIRETLDRSSAHWESLVYRIDGENGVLAQSAVPCGANPYWKLPINMVFDNGEHWKRDEKIDFALSVATHEIGHVLGLWHRPDGSGSIMERAWSPSSPTGPTESDLDAIRALYTEPHPESPAPIPQPEPAFPPPHTRSEVGVIWTASERSRLEFQKRGMEFRLSFANYRSCRDRADWLAASVNEPFRLYPEAILIGSPVVLVADTPAGAVAQFFGQKVYLDAGPRQYRDLCVACSVVPGGPFPGRDGMTRFWVLGFSNP